jgi:hypothetical protein
MRKRTTLTGAGLLAFGARLGWPAQPSVRAQPAKDAITPAEAIAIAKEVCIYGFPLVHVGRVAAGAHSVPEPRRSQAFAGGEEFL